MKKILEPKKRIKLIRGIHYIVVVLFILCAYSILSSKETATLGATFIFFVGAMQYTHGRQCPLTLEERKARMELGSAENNDFIHGCIKDNLKLNIKQSYIDWVCIFAFVISGYEIGKLLLQAITI